ncbi:diguanylate cyclase [Conexibacter sp. W3-3-2]|uniref:Diguanylate cyclase n=2 Tax=Thermoleophilia TaxID=1497346 RepID=A0A2T4UIL6_9ACTN|nr:diguanylate cyclase [Conexibacter sp. W3-3-2]PTL59078.1 hypothetical protein C7Y72_05170 [Paraconexibacter algicola]
MCPPWYRGSSAPRDGRSSGHARSPSRGRPMSTLPFAERRAAIEAADRESPGETVPVALVLLDVDRLQAVNAEHGPAAGDELLDRLEELLRSLVRPHDTLLRIGGGTFGLALPGARRLDGLLVAERLRTVVARRPLLDGRRVTLSAGVAAVPDDGRTREEIERHARRALRWAKEHGRNLCAVAGEAVAPELDEGSGDILAHLFAVVESIDAQHLHTRDHSESVARYAVAVGQELGLDEAHVMRIRRAAFLHDIGKIAIDDTILSKPDRLTDAEFEQIKVHPVVGARMLHHAGLVEEAVWIRHHHERVDGRGYPDGLAGESIPVEARIIFVADSLEAMTSDRPYRRGMPVASALEELRRCAGTQFDPAVVDAVVRLLDDGRLEVLGLREDGSAPTC